MSAAWVAAFVALAGLVVFLALLVLGLMRRFAPLLERTEAALGRMNHDLAPSGLAIGSRIPEFELESGGTVFTDEDLRGAKAVVLFLGATCQACERFERDLSRSRAPDVGARLVVVTDDSEEALSLAASSTVTVVTQQGRSLSRVFESNVTPHAFVLDESGVVLASGTPNDWERLRQLVPRAVRGGEADSSLAAATL